VNRQQAAIGAGRISVQVRGPADGNGGERTINRTKKIDKLIDHLQEIQDTQFTGYIKINFSQGNIGRIEKFEEILKS
jgi:hypothetical protein